MSASLNFVPKAPLVASPESLPFLEDAIASGEKDREGEGQGGGEKEWVMRLSRRKKEDQRGTVHLSEDTTLNIDPLPSVTSLHQVDESLVEPLLTPDHKIRSEFVIQQYITQSTLKSSQIYVGLIVD